ncbi:MAG: hypothetical protein IJ446_08150 [Oscillospiraceae bacterium]|nr:hypothetical protein [Oscillospiraceae bacterium]
MEIDHSMKNGKTISHDEVFEKTLDTAMRGMSDFEYMVWCFAIALRYERANILMRESHAAELKTALDIYEKTDFISLGLSDAEITILKRDYNTSKEYLKWLSNQRCQM